MAATYIDDLPISPGQKEQIRSLGADTPDALFSMIQAEPNAFRSFLGGDTTERILASLDRVIGPSQKDALRQAPPSYGLGAELSTAPTLPPPRIDIARRDRLFDELQRLKSDPAHPDERRIAQLQAELERLFENSSH